LQMGKIVAHIVPISCGVLLQLPQRCKLCLCQSKLCIQHILFSLKTCLLLRLSVEPKGKPNTVK